MYVLEGEIALHMDGAEHRLGAGGMALAPRGMPHAFIVTSSVCRLLCLHTPGSAQAFYWNASEPTTRTDAAGVVDFDRIGESARRTGATVILGPPPFSGV